MQVVETYWRKPITVRLHSGLGHTFHSLEDSLDFLENEWPMRNGVHQARALALCRNAAARTVSIDVAHEAFLSACLEARRPLLIRINAVKQGAQGHMHV